MASTQMFRVIAVTVVLGALGPVAAPGWADETKPPLSESERAARIQDLQRDRTKVEQELRQLRAQPEGMARSTVSRSELSDQPTRSMKEFLESMPGVSAGQGPNGRDMSLSIRGSK